MNQREYGRRGRIGLVTPQANPTAEPEISLLLPDGVSLLSARCTSRGEPEQRFLNYFRELDSTLGRFDALRFDALGFACTASSYLLKPGEEVTGCQQLTRQFGYPVLTAAMAIEAALKHLGATRIALACPYPQWLLERSAHWWRGRGFEVTQTFSAQADMEDTRAIYWLSVDPILKQLLETFPDSDADVIVITGTGMPGLRLVRELSAATGRPVLNSNLCLAWQCLQAAGIEPGNRSPEPGYPLLGGWHNALARL